MSKVYDQPSKIAADQGIVIVDGPDGVAVSFTPRAAEETSDRLLRGAVEAHGQRVKAGVPEETEPMAEDDPDDLSGDAGDVSTGEAPDQLSDEQG